MIKIVSSLKGNTTSHPCILMMKCHGHKKMRKPAFTRGIQLAYYMYYASYHWCIIKHYTNLSFSYKIDYYRSTRYQNHGVMGIRKKLRFRLHGTSLHTPY